MNNDLNKKILELIFDYAKKTNGVIYKEAKGSKWQFVSEDKWKTIQKIKEKNPKIIDRVNTKEEVEKIEGVRDSLNIYITSQGQKIFKFIYQNLLKEEREQFYHIHGYFCTFKQGLVTLLNEDKKDAQYFFENALDKSRNLKIRNTEEEKSILETSLLLYDNPNDFVVGLKKFLINHSNYYQSNAYHFDSYERQFILKDFIEKHLPSIGTQSFTTYLTSFNSPPQETEGLFLKDDTELYLIQIDKNKVYQHIPLLELEGEVRAQVYKEIFRYIKSFIHSELKHLGVVSCDNHHDSSDPILKDHDNLYVSWTIKVRGENKVTKNELKEFIVGAIELLSQRQDLFKKEKEDERIDLLHNALKIKLKNKLLDNLEVNQQPQRKVKI